MDHPNIVKFHGVYYERCFVCIVMDKLDGGDLVEGLQRHLKERGQINCLDVVHVAYQMASSIHYLHNRNVVHRDVKGDNYLMDRKNMTDGQCKIVLTDFGTACTCKQSDRLSSGVGTKIFWPPEFFDRDYSQKVDVWAMGVIMYGLVSGRFPFRDENDVRNKEVRIPKRVHPVCEEYIRKMLDKGEKSRMSSAEVMAHPWIAGKFGQTTAGDNKPTEEEGDKEADGMVEAGVNDGIKERRQELILRMNREAESRKGISTKKQLQNHKHKKFVVADKIVQGGKASYEWMSQDQVKGDRLLDFDNMSTAPKDDPMDLAMFRKTLVEHQIDPNVFGVAKAKGLDQLAKEVETGASRLMLDAQQHKKLVRVVDVVVLKLRPSDGSRLLVEFKEKFPDGRERETLRLPGTKKEKTKGRRRQKEGEGKKKEKAKGNAYKGKDHAEKAAGNEKEIPCTLVKAWAMLWPGINFEDAVERDGRYYRDRKDEGVDPFACSEVLRSIKVPAAFGARFAWTLSGVPFILHLLRECPDNEWVFVAEDSCWLYQQSDSASLLAIKDTAATDFPEGVFQRSVCGYQLACRRIPRNKKIRCPIDLSTGKATLQEDVKFFHPIGSKLFLVQKGWLRLVQKVSLEHDREGYWDWIMSLMRTVGALRLHQPFVAGSAEHFSLVDGGRVQAAELPNASDQDA
ncbi:unnamed protein product [Symbiodinium natans]|uniref:Protein kinase domain-containing protein n=1 Tax=Symbiodinium natans TaxID=878477 RepID=A0A812QQ22_9DINO|nr:unnamed protein product [Symbiodinium natans]